MTLVSDAAWLQAINAIGGEDFDTGAAQYLRGVFLEDYLSISGSGGAAVESMSRAIECRSSDIEAHSLVKTSVIRRVSNDTKFAVRRFEPGDGGMTVIVLGS